MKHSRLKLPFALLSAGILALSACDSVEPEEDHADEVEGAILVLGGQTIASRSDPGTRTS